jgi:hypothetical protein
MASYRVGPERRLREVDPTANRVALSSVDDRAPLLACPILQGQQLFSVVLPANASARIATKLGRKLTGWIIARLTVAVGGSAPSLPYELAADVQFLTLQNDNAFDLKLDLWVY